jgi:hypothetical protein
MSRSTRKKAKEDKAEEKEQPITHSEVTRENPSGIEKVSEDHAAHLGTLRGFGGPGAAGATVAGPIVHVATSGGTKPLPDKSFNEEEHEEPSGGAEPGDDQPTSQKAALESGEPSKAEEESTDEHNQQAE